MLNNNMIFKYNKQRMMINTARKTISMCWALSLYNTMMHAEYSDTWDAEEHQERVSEEWTDMIVYQKWRNWK